MYKYLFGPVPSRRLGISLGIDLVEPKTCNFDCIYCECGKSLKLIDERKSYIDNEKMLEELKEVLAFLEPDYITFSGAGEPTLNSDLKNIISEVKKISTAKLAVITNSSTLYIEEVRNSLLGANLVIPSLDSVLEDSFKKINKPLGKIKLKDILEGLKKFTKEYSGKIFLEIFIVEGVNDREKDLKAFVNYLKTLKVDKIQLNSLSRPGAYEDVKPASMKRLEEIKTYFTEQGISNVEIIKKFKKRSEIKNYDKKVEELLVNMLKKRSYEIKDLETVLGLSEERLYKYLSVLEKDKKINFEININSIYIKLNK